MYLKQNIYFSFRVAWTPLGFYCFLCSSSALLICPGNYCDWQNMRKKPKMLTTIPTATAFSHFGRKFLFLPIMFTEQEIMENLHHWNTDWRKSNKCFHQSIIHLTWKRSFCLRLYYSQFRWSQSPYMICIDSFYSKWLV